MHQPRSPDPIRPEGVSVNVHPGFTFLRPARASVAITLSTVEEKAVEHRAAHEVTLEYRSHFLVPSCSCGWVGTARLKAANAREEARDHALLYSSSDLSGLMLPKFDDLDALSELDALDSAERDPDA